MTDKIFLTTTLPYINAPRPHVGHFLEFAQADVIARYIRSKNLDIKFNVGVDEHGLKIYQKSKELGIDTQEYCDQQSTKWIEFLKIFNISYDVFYRTASNSHISDVQKFWNDCLERGDLYKKKFSGLYCTGCESFKLDKDLVDGKCPDHNTIPESTEEENWFFRISKYKDVLLTWLDNSPDFLSPSNKINELRNVIENSEDISVSRLKTSVPWGVDVPNDLDQVIYCWFSALLNYIFAAGEYWDGTTIQLCGPDNLRFQGQLFQTFLASANKKHTSKLLIHGTVLDGDGRKLSKSLGNGIDPIDQINKYGLDAVRYYAIRGLSTYGNGCWSENDLVELFNSELGDDYGNLISRTLHLIDIKLVKITSPDDFFKKDIDDRILEVKKQLDEFQLNQGVKLLNLILKSGNKYINDNKPWSSDDYSSVLNNLHYLLSVTTEYLTPIIPDSCERVVKALLLNKKEILFPKIINDNLISR